MLQGKPHFEEPKAFKRLYRHRLISLIKIRTGITKYVSFFICVIRYTNIYLHYIFYKK
jgi:hypothetical protein